MTLRRFLSQVVRLGIGECFQVLLVEPLAKHTHNALDSTLDYAVRDYADKGTLGPLAHGGGYPRQGNLTSTHATGANDPNFENPYLLRRLF